MYRSKGRRHIERVIMRPERGNQSKQWQARSAQHEPALAGTRAQADAARRHHDQRSRLRQHSWRRSMLARRWVCRAGLGERPKRSRGKRSRLATIRRGSRSYSRHKYDRSPSSILGLRTVTQHAAAARSTRRRLCPVGRSSQRDHRRRHRHRSFPFPPRLCPLAAAALHRTQPLCRE